MDYTFTGKWNPIERVTDKDGKTFFNNTPIEMPDNEKVLVVYDSGMVDCVDLEICEWDDEEGFQGGLFPDGEDWDGIKAWAYLPEIPGETE